MNIQLGIPKGAIVAINDLLDNCAKIQPGQEVLLLAEIEGLYGGDSMREGLMLQFYGSMSRQKYTAGDFRLL